MDDATLTSKSQLTLPKAVRETLGVQPGDRIRFLPTRDGFRVVAVKGDISRLRGMFKGRRAKPLSIDDMNAAISEMGSPRRPHS
ncbi:MAG TPA: AbrB/MazE/SpoVT family DNA-binding domain-containing protein [Caldimonas sp.]|nr:AbrB/MazE/SpoVT family DNA-binding domain-containing protein [Caldimonas sp.]